MKILQHWFKMTNCCFNGNYVGQALKITDTTNVTIENSIFENLTSFDEGGGAIYIDSSLFSFILIQNSSFRSNIACFGGSLLMKGLYNLTLIQSKFYDNVAITTSSKKCGVGAVAVLNCRKSFDCFFTVSQNVFMNNFAAVLAPTIFSKSLMFETNNIFFNNSDGSNITTCFLSFPLSIKLLNYAKNSSIISSGSINSLTFYLQDSFNQSFTMGIESLAIIFNDFSNSNLTLQNSLRLLTNQAFIIFQI